MVAAAALEPTRQQLPRRPHVGDQVDVERQLPHVSGVPTGSTPVATPALAKKTSTGPSFILRTLEQRGDRRLVGDVTRHRHVTRAEFLPHTRQRLLCDVGHRDPRALGGAPQRQRATDPPRPARDHDGPPT